MAAVSPAESVEVVQTVQDPGEPCTVSDILVMREPVVPLFSPVSGLQPLSWSQEHQLAVCTASSLSILELQSDFQNWGEKQFFLRSSISIPSEPYQLQVGTTEEQEKAKETFDKHIDPTIRNVFLTDGVMNPTVDMHKGIKCASWSPPGCDSNGRCLLACLTLKNTLTIHYQSKRQHWNTSVNLTEKYGERLKERGYARKDGKPVKSDLLDFDEYARRFRMQTPLTMEWSSIYTTKQIQPDNTSLDLDVIFLAVMMENGDLVLWKFVLPFTGEEDVAFYDLMESEVSRLSDLAWWEYNNAGRRMSGLIVGSELGPVKIMPVTLKGVKGYFTLRLPIILWKHSDGIAVKNIQCVLLTHPITKTSSSLILALRGCYLFWCLLIVSPTGLNSYHSHLTELSSLPLVSLTVSRDMVTVYICSIDGWIQKLTPKFTETSITFTQEDFPLPESLAYKRIRGIAVSHNSAYLALVSTDSMVGNFHSLNKSYHLHFLILKTPEAAGELLLSNPASNLYVMTDLVDLFRWKIMKDKLIPIWLQLDVDQKIQEADSLYFWRLKLFLLRILLKSLQKPPQDEALKFPRRQAKVVKRDTGKNKRSRKYSKICNKVGAKMKIIDYLEMQKTEVHGLINTVKDHLVRENIKKVLGTVYLNSSVTQNTSIPACGLIDYLSWGVNGQSETEINPEGLGKVPLSLIKSEMSKQAFCERCSLCQAVIPFTNHERDTCENGHTWLRCVLSYRACQTLTFRRCLLEDGVARLPEPEDPEWMKKLLKAPCVLCDSPML